MVQYHLHANDTIGSLSGAGNVNLSSSSSDHKLTVGANNQSSNFSGVLYGSGELTKTGTGTLTLSGDNTYTYYTTIEEGALRVKGSINAGSVGVKVGANGTYEVANSDSVAALQGEGSVALIGSSVLQIGGNNDTQFDGIISGTGSLEKAGDGELVLLSLIHISEPTRPY